MAICDNCKKNPLEYREINEVIDKDGHKKILCDDCYRELFNF